MKTILKGGLYLLALIGAGTVALNVYMSFVYGGCERRSAPPVTSFNGETYAVMTQTSCSDPSQSRTSVLMGRPGDARRTVVMEIQETPRVQLTWIGASQLRVTLPTDARARVYTPSGWPRVVVERR